MGSPAAYPYTAAVRLVQASIPGTGNEWPLPPPNDAEIDAIVAEYEASGRIGLLVRALAGLVSLHYVARESSRPAAREALERYVRPRPAALP